MKIKLLQNVTIFITGASSGIGKASATLFAEHGAKLIIAARRIERLQQLAEQLHQQFGTQCYPLAMDMSDETNIKQAFKSLPAEWKSIDVLINNAGLALALDTIANGNSYDWHTMIDTNVKGVLHLTQLILPIMLNQQKGFIVNIGSISGYQTYAGGAVYCATKYALRAINEGLRHETLGTNIRVTLINPGMVETEFSEVRFKGDQLRAASVYNDIKVLEAKDVAETIFFCITRPAHVDIQELLVMPTCQSGVGNTYREKA